MPMGFSVESPIALARMAGLPAVCGKSLLVWTMVWAAALLVSRSALAGAPPGYTLAWSDEFNQGAGSKPSSTRWTYDLGASGWGNAELQNYVSDAQHAQIVADAAATDGQALQIRATKDAGGGYTSARIKTQGKFSFQYGYVEARIRMPYGQGIWPAFWMLGTDISSVGWPACGEVDIMENIGREPSIVHGTLHGPGYSGGNGLGSAYTLPNGAAFKDAYHTFAVRWRADAITFSVDGIEYATRTAATLPAGTQWAYNKPLFLILNLAVGGNWPGYPDATTVFPQDLRIDYVRVYKLLPPAGKTITLKSAINGKYVTAGPEGGSALIASQTGATLAERFSVVDAGNDTVALQSPVNGRYVSATDGSKPLQASAASIGPSERFLWVDAGKGSVALRSQATDRYVCADNAGSSALIANRAAVDTWESFGAAVVDTAALSADGASALSAAAGIAQPDTPDATRLNVETGDPAAPGVNLSDALRLARRAAGLDPL